MALSKDVEEAIRANLPGQTAGVLKKYFEEHEQLVKDYEGLEIKNKSLEDSLKYSREENTKCWSYKGRLEEIEKGEKELAEKRIEFRIAAGIQEVQEQHSIQRVEDHKNMFNTVFKNSIIRKESIKNHVVKNPPMWTGQYDSNGQQVMQDSGEIIQPDTDTETTTEE